MRNSIDYLSIQIDHSDRDLIKPYNWTLNIHGCNQYLTTRIDGRKVRLHQLLLGFPDYAVAHKDGNTLNNRRENLIRRSEMAVGCVHRKGKRYIAKIGSGNSNILGYSDTKSGALQLLKELR
jgi:hypothetical protein